MLVYIIPCYKTLLQGKAVHMCGFTIWNVPKRIRMAGIQYIPRNMHTVFALLCFVVVIHWLIFSYPSGLLHWHCGNLTIAPVPAKQPWWIWINTSCEFIMNDCITTTKQSTTKPCAYFLGYTWYMNSTKQAVHQCEGIISHQNHRGWIPFYFMYGLKCSTTFPWCTINAPVAFA